MEVLVKFKPTFRLLLTGTPLQNNLSELWSLLHFVIPGVFRNAEAFESWFEFGDVQAAEGQKELIEAERKSQTIAKLHAILKPYMLRRVKADVIKDLPPKREYVLYATLTPTQREIYDQIKLGTIRDHLESKALKDIESRQSSGTTTPNKRKRKSGNGVRTPNKSTKSSRASTPGTGGLSIRLRRELDKKSYREMEEGEGLYQAEHDNGPEKELDEEAQAAADIKQRLAQASK
jgi:ATP-dependent DNA helicase